MQKLGRTVAWLAADDDDGAEGKVIVHVKKNNCWKPIRKQKQCCMRKVNKTLTRPLHISLGNCITVRTVLKGVFTRA